MSANRHYQQKRFRRQSRRNRIIQNGCVCVSAVVGCRLRLAREPAFAYTSAASAPTDGGRTYGKRHGRMLADHAATENGPGRRFLVALVSAVCRCPRTVRILSVVLSALSVWAAAARLQYHTSRNDLLSPDKDYQKRWQQYLAEFGDDDDIVVVVRGGDREHMKAAVEALADRVRQQPELFDRVFYNADLPHLPNPPLLLHPDPALQP